MNKVNRLKVYFLVDFDNESISRMSVVHDNSNVFVAVVTTPDEVSGAASTLVTIIFDVNLHGKIDRHTVEKLKYSAGVELYDDALITSRCISFELWKRPNLDLAGSSRELSYELNRLEFEQKNLYAIVDNTPMDKLLTTVPFWTIEEKRFEISG